MAAILLTAVMLYICWQAFSDLICVIQPVIAFCSVAAQATAGNGMQSGKSVHCILLLLLSPSEGMFLCKLTLLC